MLNGVRGTGKTTLARIIARSVNCIGKNSEGGVTPKPCGICKNCIDISEDRHVDVIEMDAASRTGVDDIRELLDGVRYRPVLARNKIYIIDEVHMLSTQAFNALLKTLEEPPEHVRFIFATTEIRKIPVTVLSRCQRFDLKRISPDAMLSLLGEVCKKEKVQSSNEALALIVRSAGGSARDALSILDQVISQVYSRDNDINLDNNTVRSVLGLMDHVKNYDLLELIFKGNIKKALILYREFYASGADPLAILKDLIEIVHLITTIKIIPDIELGVLVSESEKERILEMSKYLNTPILSRSWQMLLKGLSEARLAPSSAQAVEMLFIRMAYISDFPSPEETIKLLSSKENTEALGEGSTKKSFDNTKDNSLDSQSDNNNSLDSLKYDSNSQKLKNKKNVVSFNSEESDLSDIGSINDIVRHCLTDGEIQLASQLSRTVHLVSFRNGFIELRPKEGTPKEFPGRLSDYLKSKTGGRWIVSVSNKKGDPTLYEQNILRISEDPLVKSILDAFPGARIDKIESVSKK